MHKLIATILSLFMLLIVNVSAANKNKKTDVAAWVNKEAITHEEVQVKSLPVTILFKKKLNRELDKATLQKIKNKALNRLITRKVVLTSEMAQSINFSAIEIENYVKAEIRNNGCGSLDQYKAYLLSKGITWESWRKELKEKMIIDSIKESLSKQCSPCSNREAKALFSRQQDRFFSGGRVKVSLIILDPEKAYEGNSRRYATAVGNNIFDMDNKAWEDNARQFSIGKNALAGGHWDWIDPSKLPFGFEKIVSNMDVEKIVKISYGDYYYFIRLDAIEKKKPLSFEEAKMQIEESIQKNKIAEAWNEWFKKEIKKAVVKVL